MGSVSGKPYIYFATPAYGGNVTVFYAMGVIKTLKTLGENKWPCIFDMPAGESLITRGRNHLVQKFLASEATHLFFIDADIGFDQDDVGKLLLADLDVVAGAYPIKRIDWERAFARKQMGMDPARNSDLVVNQMKGFGVGMGELLEVKETGTGFLCIKRHVLERVIEAHPEILYQEGGPYKYDDGRPINIANVFHADIVDDFWDDGSPWRRYLSEDYWFCHQWRAMGGKVYLHLGCNLTHHGIYTYQGDSQSMCDSRRSLTASPGRGEAIMEIFSGKYDTPNTNPTIIVDERAHEGAFAVWASRRWPKAELHLYEPDPEQRQLLHQNLNGYSVNARVHDSRETLPEADLRIT